MIGLDRGGALSVSDANFIEISSIWIEGDKVIALATRHGVARVEAL